ncbi:hypothetical protein BH24ACT15_BH24ACT15_31380 [soil metagenome]
MRNRMSAIALAALLAVAGAACTDDAADPVDPAAATGVPLAPTADPLAPTVDPALEPTE